MRFFQFFFSPKTHNNIKFSYKSFNLKLILILYSFHLMGSLHLFPFIQQFLSVRRTWACRYNFCFFYFWVNFLEWFMVISSTWFNVFLFGYDISWLSVCHPAASIYCFCSVCSMSTNFPGSDTFILNRNYEIQISA